MRRGGGTDNTCLRVRKSAKEARGKMLCLRSCRMSYHTYGWMVPYLLETLWRRACPSAISWGKLPYLDTRLLVLYSQSRVLVVMNFNQLDGTLTTAWMAWQNFRLLRLIFLIQAGTGHFPEIIAQTIFVNFQCCYLKVYSRALGCNGGLTYNGTFLNYIQEKIGGYIIPYILKTAI